MNRDRRTRNPRACRPRQGARRIGGGWAVDDRWAGIATVPRSAAAESLLEFAVLEVVSQPPEPAEPLEPSDTERRVSLRRPARTAEAEPEEESV